MLDGLVKNQNFLSRPLFAFNEVNNKEDEKITEDADDQAVKVAGVVESKVPDNYAKDPSRGSGDEMPYVGLDSQDGCGQWNQHDRRPEVVGIDEYVQDAFDFYRKDYRQDADEEIECPGYDKFLLFIHFP